MPLTKVEKCEDSGGEPVNKRNESRRLQMIVMTNPVENYAPKITRSREKKAFSMND